jgi:hypothetical protein
MQPSRANTACSVARLRDSIELVTAMPDGDLNASSTALPLDSGMVSLPHMSMASRSSYLITSRIPRCPRIANLGVDDAGIWQNHTSNRSATLSSIGVVFSRAAVILIIKRVTGTSFRHRHRTLCCQRRSRVLALIDNRPSRHHTPGS